MSESTYGGDLLLATIRRNPICWCQRCLQSVTYEPNGRSAVELFTLVMGDNQRHHPASRVAAARACLVSHPLFVRAGAPIEISLVRPRCLKVCLKEVLDDREDSKSLIKSGIPPSCHNGALVPNDSLYPSFEFLTISAHISPSWLQFLDSAGVLRIPPSP